jgi:2-polyprenyl-6-methoxyphenol hydroxylase-like FAD-dependent oxidoreductase
MTVLIAGGGIAGLALGLTCHQIGVPFKVFEAVREIKPLGVGINLQPTAVRELFDLGFEYLLPTIGVKTRDYGMYSKKGLEVWVEPRGTWAGYNWPQYSVHRGELHMMLYDALVERAGADCIETGWSVERFENIAGEAALHLKHRDGTARIERGAVAVGADGIHSTIRQQMVPDQGEPRWAGQVLWRGTTQAKPFKSGASMVMIGTNGLRFVSYPISEADPKTGLATINWISELKYDPDGPFNKEDWSREANLADFLPELSTLEADWIDIPALITGADRVYEYPMVDRDPIDAWTDGNVTLMGDAAHAAYPVGSNGAGSAIIDARQLGAAFLDHGVNRQALLVYEGKMLPPTSAVVLMNRGSGPDSILGVIEDRCGGVFEDIEDVIPKAELAAHAAKYKAAAGFGIKETNAAPPTIPKGARIDG